MSNELILSASLKFAKGERRVNVAKAGVQLDVAGTDFIQKTQTIGTSVEDMDLGDIGTPGYMFVRNLDATNFVSIRHGASGDNVVKIRAGGIALFELASSDPQAIADAASVEIEYTVIEA